MSLATVPMPATVMPAAETHHAAGPLDHIFGTAALYSVVLAVTVFLCVPHTFADPDIWWHLRDAQILAQTHHFITHDSFSFTAANAPWMNHEWLAELPFYAAWQLAGARGLHAVTLLVIEAIMFAIFGLAFRRSRNLTLSLALAVVGTMLATVSFGPRTLLFGWLCLLAELALLHVSETRPRALWTLPALFALWVNIHGSWMIGLVVYGLITFGNAIPFTSGFLWSPGTSRVEFRRRMLVFATSVAALFLNPYGWRLVAYPFNLAFHQKLNIATVEEWHTLDLHTPRGKFALACLLLLALWQLIRPSRWKLADLLLVLVGVYSGFTYSRFLFLLAILAVPCIAATLSQGYVSHPRKPRTMLNAAVMVLLASLVWSNIRHSHGPDARAGEPIPDDFGPVVASLPPTARIFNNYTWGGRLIWTDHIPVFVDSRVDIFEYNGTFKDYLDIVHLNNTLALLEQHHITHVLFEANTPLVYFLQHTSGWDTIYQRKNVVLLAHRSSASNP